MTETDTSRSKVEKEARDIERFNGLNNRKRVAVLLRALLARAEKAEAESKRLRAALEECQRDIDDYIRQEYPLDHPSHEVRRERDFAANPARAALKGKDQ